MEQHTNHPNKHELLNELLDIPVSPYKNTFIERFIEVSERFFSKKLEQVNRILPKKDESYEIPFLKESEIRSLVGNGHFDDKASVSNIIAQIKILIQETGIKCFKTEAISSRYDSIDGIVRFTYLH